MNESRDEGRFWFVALVLMCVGGVVYFFNLGASGFSMSEGHRVAPAWEMLADGDWLMPHMFEQAYMRKPPGMPWAIGILALVETIVSCGSGIKFLDAAMARCTNGSFSDVAPEGRYPMRSRFSVNAGPFFKPAL